jgi:hypothetical protein
VNTGPDRKERGISQAEPHVDVSARQCRSFINGSAFGCMRTRADRPYMLCLLDYSFGACVLARSVSHGVRAAPAVPAQRDE